MKLRQICFGKIAVTLLSTEFFARKYVQNQHKQSKAKTKSIKPKLLKTLNMNQF